MYVTGVIRVQMMIIELWILTFKTLSDKYEHIF
jgi:hypothetical protein